MTTMKTGLEQLLCTIPPILRGRRVGAVCNPTAVARVRRGEAVALEHLVFGLRAVGVDVERLFGPEHGLWATAQDMIGVEGGLDPVFDRPVATLYGHDAGSLTPRPEALEGLDVLIFDVQDIGTRYYTFAATLCLCLEAAATAGVSVLVLDRPNPLGGEAIEGNRVWPGFTSFVGLFDTPQRHALTIAEIARLYRAERGLDVDLHVVPVEGWDPARYLDEQACDGLGTAWVQPSPNMPTVDTAVVYPGLCLVEGTNLSEGRGTTRPFEVVGAPWLEPRVLAEAMERVGMPGAALRPLLFEPTFHKHARTTCGGVAFHVYDRRCFEPLRAGLLFVLACRALAPEAFAWRTETYEFVQDRLAFDLLMGSDATRLAIEAGASLDDLTRGFRADERRFAERARPHLLYDRSGGLLAARSHA